LCAAFDDGLVELVVWEVSFQWLAQFVHAEAARQNDKEKLGALLALFLGGIWLFGPGDD